MSSAVVSIPIYEPIFNSLSNKFEDKTTQDLNRHYKLNGVICNCFQYKKNTNNNGFYSDMYKFKRHLNTVTHKKWLEYYNSTYNIKEIESKSLEEIKSQYIQLIRDNRKKIADMKLSYEQKENELLNELEKERETSKTKDVTIEILTNKIKELETKIQKNKQQETLLIDFD